MDAALRASEERRELAERATGVGVFDWDLVTDQIQCSAEIYRLHGLSPDTPVTYEAWLATIHPDDRSPMQAAVAAMKDASREADAASDELTENEYRVVLPDGAVRWIASRVRVLFGADGRPVRLLGVNFDTTERKEVERALHDSEERLRLATEALAGFLYDWDPIANRVEWFGGTEQVLGFRLDEVSADVAWFESRVHPDDLPQGWAAVRAAFESGASGYLNVYRVLHRDGYYVHVADRSRIIRDKTGRPIRVLGGVSDISERRHLEGEKAELLKRDHEARATAEAAVRARDDVLATVSHELGNRLSAISICAAALAEGPQSSESAPRLIGMIRESTDRMQRLLRDLLDVASIESNGLALELRKETPAALVAAAADAFAETARDLGIALDTRAPDQLPAFRADGDRIVQALANLIVNALKFTERGGRVLVCAELATETIRFTVGDTGMGIPAEDLPHIWDRFWHRQGAGGRAGRGLGLAIVRGIVEAHGVQLRVESSPGHGSDFSFTIPNVIVTRQ